MVTWEGPSSSSDDGNCDGRSEWGWVVVVKGEVGEK